MIVIVIQFLLILQHDSQYDYYGKMLATCASDGNISVFDVSKKDKPNKISSFKAHKGPVW